MPRVDYQNRLTYTREYRAKHPEKTRVWDWRKRHKNPEIYHVIGQRATAQWRKRNPEKSRWSSLRGTAKRRGFKMELTFDQHRELVNRGCFYCSTPLKESIGHCLDRIENTEGYTVDNVLPCCGPCNYMRGVWLTVEEMQAAMEAVKKVRLSKAIPLTEVTP
jgi:hypothetical protein